MSRLRVADRIWEVDLVVFDKDGTLIDFHWMWGQRVRQAVEVVVGAVPGRPRLASELYEALGYDSKLHTTRADAPLAVATMGSLSILAAGVLFRNGMGWHAAEELVSKTFARALGVVPEARHIRALGDIRALFGALRAAGTAIALLTADNRAATLATLPILGIEDRVDAMICGDDRVAPKPSPEPLLQLADRFSTPLDRIMMVGDSVSDMMTGRNAGVACCVAVLSGTAGEQELRPCADAVIESVHDILVLAHD